MSFSNFDLKEDFISSIEAAGYLSPTPLQAQLIPLVAEKKSALIWTQSASGKTGSFLIPAINYILENPAPEKRGARILVLTSRRDRVSQINYTIKRLSSNHTMRFGFIVSGRPYQTQMRLMRRPLDIMIATPGRLNDLMNNGKADFSQLEMLIIDDLTSIYQKNLHGLVEKIIEQADKDCPSLTFARDSAEVTSYAKSLFPNAVELRVNDENNNIELDPNNKERSNENMKPPETSHEGQSTNTKELMPQKVHIADDYTHKIAMMDYLMDEFAGKPTIVYVSTYKSAKTLQDNLANHGHTAELLQDLSLEEINENDILIIHDQDKTELSNDLLEQNDENIIHFDLPRRTDRFLERVSKHTQKRENTALLLVDGYNYNELKHLEKILGVELEKRSIPGLEPLKPFVNLSKHKSGNKHSQRSAKTSKPNANNRKPRKDNRNTRNRKHGAKDSSGTESNSRPQRKGSFGRLNGGANRKKASNSNNRTTNHRTRKIGVSTRGTAAPKDSRSWESDFAEPQERKTESKNVVIRYSNKKSLINKPDDA